MLSAIRRHKLVFALPILLGLAGAVFVFSGKDEACETTAVLRVEPADSELTPNNLESTVRAKLPEINRLWTLEQVEEKPGAYNLTCRADSIGQAEETAELVATAFVQIVDEQQPKPEKETEGSENKAGVQQKQAQLKSLRAQLEESRLDLERFRIANKNALSTDRQAILEEIDQRKNQTRELSEQLAIEQDRTARLEKELAATPEKVVKEESQQVDPRFEMIQTEVYALRLKRSKLLLKYTEKHPEVVEIDKQLTLYQEKLDELGEPIKTTRTEALNPVYQNLQERLSESRMRAEGIESHLQLAKSRLEQSQQKTARVNEAEEELAQLTSSTEGLQDEVSRLEAALAEISTEREKQDPAVRTTLTVAKVAPARVAGDNTPLWALACGFAGMILGVALAWMMERANPALYTAEDASNALGVAVLGTMPVLVPLSLEASKKNEKLLEGKQ